MYYMLNKDTYFRSYGDVGYITSTGFFTDRLADASGAVFLQSIDREPAHIDAIANKIASSFIDADLTSIKEDAIEFFKPFVEDGFIICGNTPEGTKANASGFSYNIVEPRTMKQDFTPEHLRAEPSTQDTLGNFFLVNPQLTHFQMELTSRCNERCLHCYIPHELKEGDISPDLFYSVLDQLEELGAWHITLSGGEPMLHSHFKEFLRAAKDRDFYVSILSNLTRLDDEIVEIMAEGNKSSVQVSLYSMIPEHHDEITQLLGSHAKTIAAIEKLIANDIPVQVSCPTMKENKNDFGDVLRWAHDHKIRAITDYSIMAEYNNDTSNLVHRLNPEECGEVIHDILEWDIDYQDQILSPDFEQEAKEYSRDLDAPLCGVGISTCCMVSNGNVYPCAGWQSYTCGNLNDQTIEDIWLHSEKMNELRSLRRRDMKPCIGCDMQAFCSPCMVRNANESPTGDPFEVSPYFCEVAKVNHDLVMQWREEHLSIKH